MATYGEYLKKYNNYRDSINAMCRAAICTLESRKSLDLARYGTETIPAACRLAMSLEHMRKTSWNDACTRDAAKSLIVITEHMLEHIDSRDEPLEAFAEGVRDLTDERLSICRAFAKVAPLLTDNERERIEASFDNDARALLYVIEYIAL